MNNPQKHAQKIFLFIFLITAYSSYSQCESIKKYSDNSIEFTVANGTCASYPDTIEVTNNETGTTATFTKTCLGNSPKVIYSNPNADIGDDFSLNTGGAGVSCTYLKGVSNAKVLAVSEFELLSKSVTVYPNPVQKSKTLNINNASNKNISVSVFDITGKILTSNVASNNALLELDITSYSRGFYLIKLVSGAIVINKRFIVSE